ncbi:homogentisate 1,2-dioxygenase [Methylosinus sp. C49]|uniref:homogentisate 1,2-dioxygenase n=1 Tax=Methylosinus sp. C49 TaxID=2699395 RepID=UPI0013678F22|nr:homogentisate 1,2-dioxygenase [Methylosinus sp. C49]BBU63397.1 homogentisate 1,2-dioxygenase [Methylosinus sp. C49]
MTLRYMSGFGNEFASEALPGALPVGQNSPQHCPYKLYAEQLSGSPFTAPRGANTRSWLYRIRPSVRHVGRFERLELPFWQSAPSREEHDLPLGRYRWGPPPMPDCALTFLAGVRMMTTAGDADAQSGMAAGLYFVTRSMIDDYFYDADGELLLLPQKGALRLVTEFGVMEIAPGEIGVLPRGVKFKAELVTGPARGYLCENYGAPFTLPNRGPIGANCLANARDFETPVAAFGDAERPCRLTVKWGGKFFICGLDHSPLDVVAWHGDYAPYKYDLRRFAPVGALLFDHPDPSIFCVLTAPSEREGTANIDFLIFPERWLVAEHTFRPPWFHMNVMSEFMGLIYGRYDAKAEGFAPGGVSLHNSMLPHGPDAQSFAQASAEALAPQKLEGTLAFMLETRLPQHLTRYAARLETYQNDYADCWAGLARRFDGTP